ncbi:MAG TPA: effector binding domain-containing protein [Spirochaetota bacterium]|nr:effector binding domain-containing protein [Spirochaetota bacterium]
MKYELLFLNKQKYMGIKTKIMFKDHDNIDFARLQKDVINAGIKNIDRNQRFMAIDSDFTKESFSYTPLVAVSEFEGDGFTRYTREEGEYYCFDVNIKDLGPKWFDTCIKFIEQNGFQIDREYDLEYYPEDYLSRIGNNDFLYSEETIQIIFKKK